jgi:hypothetical protein
MKLANKRCELWKKLGFMIKVAPNEAIYMHSLYNQRLAALHYNRYHHNPAGCALFRYIE